MEELDYLNKILSAVIFLVIMVAKSSLALSLGLVGALSIASSERLLKSLRS
jgi:hypothetical protein